MSVLDAIARRLGYAPATPPLPAGPFPLPDGYRSLTEAEQARLENGQCPFCPSTEMYAGPQGGICENTFCANPDCRARLNVPMVRGMRAEFTGLSPDEVYA